MEATHKRPFRGAGNSIDVSWFDQFRAWGWNARYIGDECDYADVDVGGIPIALVPKGREFIDRATFESRGNILIIEGPPVSHRWWFVDYVSTPMLMDVWVREKSGRMETPEELMRRGRCRFE